MFKLAIEFHSGQHYHAVVFHVVQGVFLGAYPAQPEVLNGVGVWRRILGAMNFVKSKEVPLMIVKRLTAVRICARRKHISSYSASLSQPSFGFDVNFHRRPSRPRASISFFQFMNGCPKPSPE